MNAPDRSLVHWFALARHAPLGLVADLDGTLIPFAPTPAEARPGQAVVALLSELASQPGLTAAVVSGRPREDLDRFFGEIPQLLLVAEHGAWRRGEGAWQAMVEANPAVVDGLASQLQRVVVLHPGSFVERKSWSMAFHFRRVPEGQKEAALVEAAAAIESWMESQSGYEMLEGSEVLEVRPNKARKSNAVLWLRERLGPEARIVALGDDVTDEDTFRALETCDEGIVVGLETRRRTAARFQLPGPREAVEFLRWLALARAEIPTPPLVSPPEAIAPSPRRARAGEANADLLVISNRLPELRSPTAPREEARRSVGGLVSALEPVLAARRGLWLGWSGRTVPDPEPPPARADEESGLRVAWIDLPRIWKREYYDGFCNRALWPLLHGFPGRLQFHDEDWTSYQKANEAFAAAAAEFIGPDTTVWAHDYHLLLVARALRALGHRGPIGIFFHVPFPGVDVFSLLPWASEILAALLEFDLVGFHTPGYVESFRSCVGALTPARVADDAVEFRGRRTRVGAFPIGIVPANFQDPSVPEAAEDIATFLDASRGRRLVLGVDRLDYTKGIPERLLAFGRLFELFPQWRGKVSLLQISVPSRADIPEYVEQRSRVEAIVGRVNGEFGEIHWVPIRYVYRGYRSDQLAQLYRAADVGYVTPLRDGMNLVAKEYVAAQDPENPGVLLLSRFAGAAVELRDALLTNPWHIDGLARDLDRALSMPLEERISRHEKVLAATLRTTALDWAESFLARLAACR